MPEILTAKKKQWAGKFKPGIVRGGRLNYNAGVTARYEARLTALVRQMVQQTEREIVRLFKTSTAAKHFEREMVAQDADVSSQARILLNEIMRRFQQLFNSKANGLAQQMLGDSDKASASAIHGSLKQLSGGLSLKTKFVTKPMQTILKAHIAENVSLIKSIPQRYFTDIQGAVMRSITTGNGLQDLVPAIQKTNGVALRRARIIAADQTRKAYSDLNFERMAKIGVKEFEWVHSGGGDHPRELHLDMDGKIYRMDNLPIIDDKTGERGIPGQLINCRCTMTPVIDFGGENAS